LVRHYGVILDWGDGTLLPETTKVFREMLQRRTVSKWAPGPVDALTATGSVAD
jgi:N-methylhydantoinase B